MPDQPLTPKERASDFTAKAIVFVFFVAPMLALGLYLSWELFFAPLFRGRY